MKRVDTEGKSSPLIYLLQAFMLHRESKWSHAKIGGGCTTFMLFKSFFRVYIYISSASPFATAPTARGLRVVHFRRHVCSSLHYVLIFRKKVRSKNEEATENFQVKYELEH